MTTTDPRAAAIEAAARAYYGVNGYDWREDIDEGDKAVILREFTEVVAAAVGPLLAPVRALADHLALTAPSLNRGKACAGANCGACRQAAAARRIREALDAIESGATSEGAGEQERGDR